MAPATRRASRWADLPPELVETILRRLHLDDFVPFGLACKSWWSAMINARSLFKPPPVLILKPANPFRKSWWSEMDAHVTSFYSIRGGGNLRDVPTMMIRPNPLNSSSHGVPATDQQIDRSAAPAARCCGSSMGWLVMVVDEYSVHLPNPISAEKVALPALPPHISLWSWDDLLCSKPASDPDCIVALIGYRSNTASSMPHTFLLTCSPNDEEWTPIPYRSYIHSYALYEARLYVFSHHAMFIYDFDPHPRMIRSLMRKSMGMAVKETTVLAVMDGKLLCVTAAPAGPHRAYEFVDNCRWAMIQSLGEWVLLMNRFTSQAFSTKESPTLGFRANCIYRKSFDSIRVYSMEDDGLVTICLPRLEAGSENIRPSSVGYHFHAYWVLAQSW